MMALRRGFTVVARLQKASQLKGSEYQAEMDDLYKLHQSSFASQTRQQNLQIELTQDRKALVDTLVDHLLDLSPSEVNVLVSKLRPSSQINWNIFRREDQFRMAAEEGPLKDLGLVGYPAEMMTKILTGELFEGLAPIKAQEVVVQEEAKAEKTTFNLILKGFDSASKVKLIKEVKDQLALGLKESKEKVEETAKGPVLLFKSIPKEQAEERLAKFKAIGADVELE